MRGILEKKRIFIEKIFSNHKYMLTAFLILAVVASVFIYIKIDFNAVISAFSNATLKLILTYVLLQVTMMAVLTWRWKLILESQGIKNINLVKLNNYRLVSQSIGFMTATGKLGGEPIRAGLLSSRHNVDFNKGLSSVIIDRAIDLSASIVFFIFGAIIVLFAYVLNPLAVEIIIGLCAFFLVVVVVFNYRMLKGKEFFYYIFKFFGLSKVKRFSKFKQRLRNIESLIIKFYHKDTKFFYQTITVSLISWIIMFFEYKIAALILGYNLSAVQVFLVFSFVGAAYLIPIPFAIGVLEAGQISAFRMIGIGSAIGIGMSFIVRVKDILISIVGILLLGVYGMKLKEVLNRTKTIDEEVDVLKKTRNAVRIKS